MYYTDQEKAKLVEVISKSDLPVKNACKQYGITDGSFYTWRKQLAAEASKKQESDQAETGRRGQSQQALDQKFPGSKFILTIRNSPEQWYESLTRFHAVLFGHDRIPTSDDLKAATYV